MALTQILGLWGEGIERVKEALEIYGRFNDIRGQAQALRQLSRLLYEDGQFDAAEGATSKAIDLFSDEDNQFGVCNCHNTLGNIYRLRGEIEKAIDHYQTALGIASSFGWAGPQFWNNYSLAQLFFSEKRFDDAHAYIQHAKSHTASDTHNLGRAMELQAEFWYK